MNHWNELVAIMNSPKAKTTHYITTDVKSYTWADAAKAYFNGLNTASGAKTKSDIEH